MNRVFEGQRSFMESYLVGKVDDQKLVEILDKMDDQAANYNLLDNSLKTFMGYTIVGAIVSLILAAILKKRPQMYNDSTNGDV